MKPPRLSKHFAGLPVALAWGFVVVLGMAGMLHYQMTPALIAKAAPRDWPAGVCNTPVPGRYTLVMFLHPQCPCSRASLYELNQILSRANGQLHACVLFVQPENAPADWLDGDLWKQANFTPGAQVVVDPQGRNSVAFGARTSGQVMLYSPDGKLRFSGGITDGRGHAGDNAGESAILEIIHDGKSSVSQTPVFGCSLGVSTANPKGAGL